MSSMSRLIGITAILFTMCGVRAAVDPATCVPRSVNVLARLDVNRLMQSPPVTSFRTTQPEKYQDLKDGLLKDGGIELEKIQSVWLMVDKQQPGLIVVKGTFDPTLMKHALGLKEGVSTIDVPGSLLAYEVPAKRKSAKPGEKHEVVLIDNATLAMGLPRSVNDFIKASRGESEVYPASDPKLAKVLSQQGFLVVSSINFDRLTGYKAPAPAADGTAGPPPAANPLTEQVGGVLITGELTELLKVTLLLEPRKAEYQESLAALANGMIVGMLMPSLRERVKLMESQNDPTAPVFNQVLDSTTIGKKDGDVAISVQADLGKLGDAMMAKWAQTMLKQLEASKAGGGGATGGDTGTEPPAPAPAQP